ncbi:molybdenum-pterin-binding protein [Campylobacter sp. LR264d]|uniref:molybdenum-pterin-binding protein n=1 Tax=Campylobacter sp. LR264d TaxID=2593544 RepID=UPI00123B69C0|nr:molybdenum-pterin-binding protein [Campylobacter sp. LR264d]KAA6234192.1 molybdenum-pterin-binding protein [Campylobacter sp. LR264d]
MNILVGEVVELCNEGDIVIARLSVNKVVFSVLMIDLLSLDNLAVNNKIEMLFKENELFLADLNSKLSVENTFKAKIIKIVKGKLLWQVFIDFQGLTLSAIVTAKKGEEMVLKEDEEKLCFIKENDITLRI